MSLQVLRLAAGSTFQDQGRPGFRRFGVAPGGAFDRESYRLALALVGRSSGEALEIPIPGAEFEVREPDRLAIVGAGCPISLNELTVPPQSAFPVSPGDRLKVGPADQGVRIYLASARGWILPERLGSITGAPAAPVLICRAKRDGASSHARLAAKPNSLRNGPIRILPGPQAHPEDLHELSHRHFQVSLSSNRMGIRLEGGEFQARGELTSEPSVAGVVQLAPSGELLIHGPDGPTIGGYPKIAVVIDADQDRLAQLRPTAEVGFEVVDIHVARTLSQERAARLEAAIRELRAAMG